MDVERWTWRDRFARFMLLKPRYLGARSTRVERAIAGWLMHRLVRRGWLVQTNPRGECSNVREDERGRYDVGWRPVFSIRYGETPVYRISTERWVYIGGSGTP
jgi:hypothetical protein